MVFGLMLATVGEADELECSEEVATPSTQTPTAKRQRRLTLTAMTGLICELAEECPKHQPGASPTTPAAAPPGELKDSNETSAAQEVDDGERDSSPVKRLKRSRASISVTAKADVMAAQARKALMRLPGSERSSDSSDSTEEEDSLALRVRRAQAFESGALTVTDTANASHVSPGHQQGELSPRSQLAFDRGVRAAQIAAKAQKSCDSRAPIGQRPRGGA